MLGRNQHDQLYLNKVTLEVDPYLNESKPIQKRD
jgi:hypothetical protein